MSSILLTRWQKAPREIFLDKRSVHLWRFRLSEVTPADVLSTEERQRADRLRIPGKSRDFVAARTSLRQILCRYLDSSPQDIRFVYNDHGKPFLAGARLSFNLAHAGDWGLCAVTRDVEVGVDIEKVDCQLDTEKLADQFFSASEVLSLQTCQPQRRRRLFMRIWTRKEAWLKGKGGGFSEPVLDLGALHLVGCDTPDNPWWLRSFPVYRHYLGAIAVQRDISFVQRWESAPAQD